MTIHNLAVHGGARNFVWNSSLERFIYYLVSENLRTLVKFNHHYIVVDGMNFYRDKSS